MIVRSLIESKPSMLKTTNCEWYYSKLNYNYQLNQNKSNI
jgi:hypothetical protein